MYLNIWLTILSKFYITQLICFSIPITITWKKYGRHRNKIWLWSVLPMSFIILIPYLLFYEKE